MMCIAGLVLANLEQSRSFLVDIGLQGCNS